MERLDDALSHEVQVEIVLGGAGSGTRWSLWLPPSYDSVGTQHCPRQGEMVSWTKASKQITKARGRGGPSNITNPVILTAEG